MCPVGTYQRMNPYPCPLATCRLPRVARRHPDLRSGVGVVSELVKVRVRPVRFGAGGVAGEKHGTTRWPGTMPPLPFLYPPSGWGLTDMATLTLRMRQPHSYSPCEPVSSPARRSTPTPAPLRHLAPIPPRDSDCTRFSNLCGWDSDPNEK